MEKGETARRPGTPRVAGLATYTLEDDALYVRLSGEKVAGTVTVRDDYMVDVDAEGRPVGVELLGVRADAERQVRDHRVASAASPAVVAHIRGQEEGPR